MQVATYFCERRTANADALLTKHPDYFHVTLMSHLHARISPRCLEFREKDKRFNGLHLSNLLPSSPCKRDHSHILSTRIASPNVSPDLLLMRLCILGYIRLVRILLMQSLPLLLVWEPHSWIRSCRNNVSQGPPNSIIIRPVIRSQLSPLSATSSQGQPLIHSILRLPFLML